MDDVSHWNTDAFLEKPTIVIAAESVEYQALKKELFRRNKQSATNPPSQARNRNCGRATSRWPAFPLTLSLIHGAAQPLCATRGMTTLRRTPPDVDERASRGRFTASTGILTDSRTVKAQHGVVAGRSCLKALLCRIDEAAKAEFYLLRQQDTLPRCLSTIEREVVRMGR